MTVYEMLLSIIRHELCKAPLPKNLSDLLTPDTCEKLYKLSSQQDLTHMLSATVLEHANDIEPALKKKYENAPLMAMFRYTQIDFELSQVCRIFEESRLRHIPLKGSYIRDFYPSPEMRTSCDIDVYVEESELERAISILTDKLGYTAKERGMHDVSLFSVGGVHIELHFDLIDDGEQIRNVLSDVFASSHLREGYNYRYDMNHELFLLYHIAHMAKHFVRGGCGIRPFMDLLIIREKMEYDEQAVTQSLKDAGLYTFFCNAMALCDSWFFGKEHTELTLNMQSYILGAGIYGSLERRIAIENADKGGISYIFGRIFLPHAKLAKLYPVLKKCPILNPVCQIHRWINFIFFKDKSRARNEIRYSMDTNDTVAHALIQMCEELELK